MAQMSTRNPSHSQFRSKTIINKVIQLHFKELCFYISALAFRRRYYYSFKLQYSLQFPQYGQQINERFNQKECKATHRVQLCTGYHQEKAKPIPQPTATAAAPTIKISDAAFHLFRPMIVAFSIPSPKSSTAPMQIQATHGWSSFLSMPEVTMQGRTGWMPKMMKEQKAVSPRFHDSEGSVTTSLSSSSIMMSTKTCLLVEQRSATRVAFSTEKLFLTYISMISFFQNSQRCSTSYSYLASSVLTKSISALVEMQSPRPILTASATTIEMAQRRTSFASIPAEQLLRMTTRAFVEPSTPENTSDFTSYPTFIWGQECQAIAGPALASISSFLTSAIRASRAMLVEVIVLIQIQPSLGNNMLPTIWLSMPRHLFIASFKAGCYNSSFPNPERTIFTKSLRASIDNQTWIVINKV